jgi:hypothetical protein
MTYTFYVSGRIREDNREDNIFYKSKIIYSIKDCTLKALGDFNNIEGFEKVNEYM